MNLYNHLVCLALLFFSTSCSETLVEMEEETEIECSQKFSIDTSRPECTETLGWGNELEITVQGNKRVITTNSIPGHMTGLFGGGNGSLNPNTIKPISTSYSVSMSPEKASSPTWLLSTTRGPEYNFGVLLNGVQIDPEAAEPWPHSRPVNFNSANWEWNLDAMAVNLGLDCNNAHVQPTGKYHYHGSPTLYLEDLGASDDMMNLIGYAGDGFPIYYKYGYENATNSSSLVVDMNTSYRLKSGERPGNGETAPCGEYNGVYTADYEYVSGLGDLDECNGREGVTPEYPQGTYYYVITDSYPFVGRCLVGTPADDFSFR